MPSTTDSPTTAPGPAHPPAAPHAPDGYFRAIWRSARAVLEGMAVTFSYLFRPPTTVQYPDRMPRPMSEALPERYRGFLEVDMAICTGCKACERDCPIACIAIDIEKVGDVRAMTRFDIDMAKCMYCNICVESCPIPARAPGDAEDTKCIRMTREFEGATDALATLTFRFVRPGDAVVPFKPKKKSETGDGKPPIEPTPARGEIAREARARATEYNRLAAKWTFDERRRRLAAAEATALEPEVVRARVVELAPKVAAAGEDARKLEDLIYAEALAQTDCEACGYPTCRDYARGLLAGDPDSAKCEPGGARSHRDAALILQIRRGAWGADGTPRG